MNIPTFPATLKVIDDNGEMTSEYRQFFQDLISVLQQTISDEGLFAALQTTTNINQLNDSIHRGAIWYDETANQYKGNINGTIVTFTTT